MRQDGFTTVLTFSGQFKPRKFYIIINYVTLTTTIPDGSDYSPHSTRPSYPTCVSGAVARVRHAWESGNVRAYYTPILPTIVICVRSGYLFSTFRTYFVSHFLRICLLCRPNLYQNYKRFHFGFSIDDFGFRIVEKYFFEIIKNICIVNAKLDLTYRHIKKI